MTDLVLRDYQVTDIERLRDCYRHGARAALYQLATGGGKTVVFSNIVKSAAAKGRRTGVFVHRRELINQASQKLDWCNVPHGIMAAGLDRDHDAPVQVLSIQIRGQPHAARLRFHRHRRGAPCPGEDLARHAGRPNQGEVVGRDRDSCQDRRRRARLELWRAVRCHGVRPDHAGAGGGRLPGRYAVPGAAQPDRRHRAAQGGGRLCRR